MGKGLAAFELGGVAQDQLAHGEPLEFANGCSWPAGPDQPR
jgi:hypothetical protein